MDAGVRAAMPPTRAEAEPEAEPRPDHGPEKIRGTSPVRRAGHRATQSGDRRVSDGALKSSRGAPYPIPDNGVPRSVPTLEGDPQKAKNFEAEI